MGFLDRLRGPLSLATLTASFVAGRPRAALPAARMAIAVGLRVRRAPVLRSRPSLLVQPGELAEVCSLVSDTHVVAHGATPAELGHDPGQWPWRQPPSSAELARGLARVLAHIARHAPRTVLWCGDEVDTGAAPEWDRLRAIASSVPHLVHHMVPGNHDINFNQPFVADYDLTRRAARVGAFEAGNPALERFPIVDTIVGDAGPVTVILLDSCRYPSTHVLSNAIGRFGNEQLARLAHQLDAATGPVLCVAHHHVWRDARFTQPEAWFNTAVDADRLAALLVRYRARAPGNHVLVCHGHRHTLTAGEIGDPAQPIAVVGLPSTTLGDKATGGQLDGLLRYAIAGLARDGSGWRVAIREVGPLVVGIRERTRMTPATPPDASQRAYSLLGAAPLPRR